MILNLGTIKRFSMRFDFKPPHVEVKSIPFSADVTPKKT